MVQAAVRSMPAPHKCNQLRRSYAQVAAGRATTSAAMPPTSTVAANTNSGSCSTNWPLQHLGSNHRAAGQGDCSARHSGAGARGGPVYGLFCSCDCHRHSGNDQTVRYAGARALQRRVQGHEPSYEHEEMGGAGVCECLPLHIPNRPLLLFLCFLCDISQ